MQGLMMDMPLMISSLLVHADRYHGDAEIVSRRVEDGSIHRYTYRDAHARSPHLTRHSRSCRMLGIAGGLRNAAGTTA